MTATATLTRWTIVRRWRAGRSTLTIHAPGCSSVYRREIANYVHATDRTGASVAAYRAHGSEVEVGVARWGAECGRCSK